MHEKGTQHTETICMLEYIYSTNVKRKSLLNFRLTLCRRINLKLLPMYVTTRIICYLNMLSRVRINSIRTGHMPQQAEPKH